MLEAFGMVLGEYCHRIVTLFYVRVRGIVILAHSLQLMITVPPRVVYWTVLKCETFLFTPYVCNTG